MIELIVALNQTRERRVLVTPELIRALRANPRLRKRLRESRDALLKAVEDGRPDGMVETARRWAETEKAVADDLARKEAQPPKHRVTFLIDESDYVDFSRTALEYELTESEVARRYYISGRRFSEMVWRAIHAGKLNELIVTSPKRGLNLAQWALPDFSRRRA